MKTHNSIYESITQSIVERLKEGVRPWHQPWKSGSTTLPLRSNGIPYQGINVLILWMQSAQMGYTSSKWMTFKQAQELGGSVKKGERGTHIFYSNTVEKTTTDEEGNEELHKQSFLRSYSVFNVAQIQGLPAEFYGVPATGGLSPKERIASLEAFAKSTDAQIEEGGDRACYFPSLDKINMPPFASFETPESYYATLCHELVHWTGHPSRLNRELSSKNKIEAYAFEELVAELGSAFLASILGITPGVSESHVDYLGSWIALLEGNHSLIFKAASLAQRAVEFLLE